MYSSLEEMQCKLEKEFDEGQARLLSKVITDAYNELVKRSDLNDLKDIVRYLAESQKGLTEAQNRTEERIKELTLAVKDMGNQVGGLGNGIGYALENEAYRMLPKVLKERFGIDVYEKVLRVEIGGR
ncbi:MAG: hypothetical protein V1872_09930, partial [bacterium]